MTSITDEVVLGESKNYRAGSHWLDPSCTILSVAEVSFVAKFVEPKLSYMNIILQVFNEEIKRIFTMLKLVSL